MDDSEFAIIRMGFIDTIVCTSLDDDEATSRLNSEHPTGISSKWTISVDEKDHKLPCAQNPTTHTHILFHC